MTLNEFINNISEDNYRDVNIICVTKPSEVDWALENPEKFTNYLWKNPSDSDNVNPKELGDFKVVWMRENEPDYTVVIMPHSAALHPRKTKEKKVLDEFDKYYAEVEAEAEEQKDTVAKSIEKLNSDLVTVYKKFFGDLLDEIPDSVIPGSKK